MAKNQMNNHHLQIEDTIIESMSPGKSSFNGL